MVPGSKFVLIRLGKGSATKSDKFLEKCQRGGGVIFNSKIYVADFGNFKQGFLSKKLIKRRVISGFRGSGYVFSTIVLILTDIN